MKNISTLTQYQASTEQWLASFPDLNPEALQAFARHVDEAVVSHIRKQTAWRSAGVPEYQANEQHALEVLVPLKKLIVDLRQRYLHQEGVTEPRGFRRSRRTVAVGHAPQFSDEQRRAAHRALGLHLLGFIAQSALFPYAVSHPEETSARTRRKGLTHVHRDVAWGLLSQTPGLFPGAPHWAWQLRRLELLTSASQAFRWA